MKCLFLYSIPLQTSVISSCLIFHSKRNLLPLNVTMSEFLWSWFESSVAIERQLQILFYLHLVFKSNFVYVAVCNTHWWCEYNNTLVSSSVLVQYFFTDNFGYIFFSPLFQKVQLCLFPKNFPTFCKLPYFVHFF